MSAKVFNFINNNTTDDRDCEIDACEEGVTKASAFDKLIQKTPFAPAKKAVVCSGPSKPCVSPTLKSKCSAAINSYGSASTNASSSSDFMLKTSMRSASMPTQGILKGKEERRFSTDAPVKKVQHSRTLSFHVERRIVYSPLCSEQSE
mmetsp:Transcript_47089/g.65360  ORF Transcript_47089/g.65360 Transcript_47089/m.65360 type:complete len:148 (-) Transcript_47089:43-486(-)